MLQQITATVAACVQYPMIIADIALTVATALANHLSLRFTKDNASAALGQQSLGVLHISQKLGHLVLGKRCKPVHAPPHPMHMIPEQQQ